MLNLFFLNDAAKAEAEAKAKLDGLIIMLLEIRCIFNVAARIHI